MPATATKISKKVQKLTLSINLLLPHIMGFPEEQGNLQVVVQGRGILPS